MISITSVTGLNDNTVDLDLARLSLRAQRAKKVVCNSPGLVHFPIRPVILVLNLPDRQVLFFAEIQITEGL